MKEELEDLIEDMFYEMKENSSRKCVGYEETKIVDFENKKYKITINGAWDRSDWLDYKVSGVGFVFEIDGHIDMY